MCLGSGWGGGGGVGGGGMTPTSPKPKHIPKLKQNKHFKMNEDDHNDFNNI